MQNLTVEHNYPNTGKTSYYKRMTPRLAKDENGETTIGLLVESDPTIVIHITALDCVEMLRAIINADVPVAAAKAS